LGPALGPSLPSADFHPGLKSTSAAEYYSAIPELPIEPERSHDLADNSDEMLKIGHRKKEGPIVIKDVSQSNIIGDSFEKEKMKNLTTSLDRSISSESAYANLPSIINQGRGTGGRNIMQMAYEAKMRQSQLDEQRANSRAIKKMVRSKYGF
jgi:Mitotic checkpoint regulator, MAD2B-interacting